MKWVELFKKVRSEFYVKKREEARKEFDISHDSDPWKTESD